MWSQIKERRKVDCYVVQGARDIYLVVVTPQSVEAATRIYTIHCSIEGGAKRLFVVRIECQVCRPNVVGSAIQVEGRAASVPLM